MSSDQYSPGPTPLETILHYHDRTKHHYHRHARSLGYLDWDSQPNPFRAYEGAPYEELPFDDPAKPVPYPTLYGHGTVEPQSLNRQTLAPFFRFSLGLSAWKEYGPSRWALRVNPSSGNLHPTEGYAIVGTVEGWETTPAVFHYAPNEHRLETRASLAGSTIATLVSNMPPGCFLVALTSIHWRESWKYGERAFRYCQHDTGHAIAAMRLSAALLGWKMKLISSVSTQTIAALLGMDRTDEFHPSEREAPECIAVVYPNSLEEPPLSPIDESIATAMQSVTWHGRANTLSPDHAEWEVIDEAESATRQPVDASHSSWTFPFSKSYGGWSGAECDAHRIILQRRSAVDMRSVGSLPCDTFFAMLGRTLPGPWSPWDTMDWAPSVHLFLFVHRVKDIPSGLYMLVRDPKALEMLKENSRDEFGWSQPSPIPESLPLYLLQEGNLQDHARSFSCHQDIAGNGFFSLGMIARFEPTLREHGAWMYRHLFWETGMIGQVLYLEAEAAGERATGIGCFYDDAVHEAMGIGDHTFQSLYHFTMGTPVEDGRLTTHKPYPRENFLLHR